MDPVTAALNALGFLFQYLTTPAGQDFAKVQTELIVKILNLLHVHIGDQPAPPKSS